MRTRFSKAPSSQPTQETQEMSMPPSQYGQRPDPPVPTPPVTRPFAAAECTTSEDRGTRRPTHDSSPAHLRAHVDLAAQAYEMQLSLVQEQNARRLRMARELEEQAGGLSHGLRPTSPNTPAEPRSSKRKLDHLLNDGPVAGGGENGILASTTHAVARDATRTLETNSPRSGNHDHGRREGYNRPPSHIIADNAAEPPEVRAPPAAHFTRDEDRNRQGPGLNGDDAMTGGTGLSGLPFVVLYRAVCSSGHRKCNGRIYQDQPHVAVVDGEPHLAGRWPVLDLGALLATRNPMIFVVYRDSYCGDGAEIRSARHLTSPAGAEPVRDIVSIISEQLQTAIQRLSLFAPDDSSYRLQHNDNCPPRSPSLQLSRYPSEYSRYFFYHHREAIHQAVTTDPQGGEIKCLLSHLLDRPDPMYAKCDAFFNQGLVTPETLPWLFRPNEVIVCNRGLRNVAYVLRDVPEVIGSDSVELTCWNWGYDGHSLRRKDETVTVTTPKGRPISITLLPAYPLRYADERIRLQLFERGNRFWALRNQTYVSYEGPDYDGERSYPWDSRCMIDYQTYYKFHKNAEAFAFSNRTVAAFDTWPQQISATVDLSSIDTMLLPPGVHGFFLREKKWVHLLLENIAPVNWDRKAFDRLVLPQRIKDLVKKLVPGPRTEPANPPADLGRKGKRFDLVRGEGGGRTMLLYGGSGTGKTLTVESLAEFAEMPLYNVTRRDIGTQSELEKNLDFVFYLGRKWNCILLLDEADDVIAQMPYSDRENFGSVLLRPLEYYDGTLILASRGVGTIAKAFGSRIQVVLPYPALDLASRRRIWQNFLDVLRSDDERVDFDGIVARMDDLARCEMNGRQIRNAVTTACRLARSEKAAVAWPHFEQAIAATTEIGRFLQKQHADVLNDFDFASFISPGP